mmetsp:Transcript_36997/g.82249  ORF Transcript_36997/g.82249 Transcript_36997/m.82249 type:complete len:211 (-) Transcript_36997:466-1098(-)
MKSGFTMIMLTWWMVGSALLACACLSSADTRAWNCQWVMPLWRPHMPSRSHLRCGTWGSVQWPQPSWGHVTWVPCSLWLMSCVQAWGMATQPASISLTSCCMSSPASHATSTFSTADFFKVLGDSWTTVASMPSTSSLKTTNWEVSGTCSSTTSFALSSATSPFKPPSTFTRCCKPLVLTLLMTSSLFLSPNSKEMTSQFDLAAITETSP